MHVVNQFGRVVAVADDDYAKKAIAAGTFRKATRAEISALEARRAEERVQHSPGDVYFSTVRQTPDGYGMSQALLRAELAKQGIVLGEVNADQKVGLLYNYPYTLATLRNDVRLIYTMFESDKIPEDWPEYLKLADEVLVPSKWCQETFQRAGIESTVVPLGYNHHVFKYIERPVPMEERQDFVFMHYNGFNIRKGFRELLKAFTAEFGADEPVKLIIKTTLDHPPLPLNPIQYPNIQVINGAIPENDLAALLGRAHCFVYPSMGEGFGITPLEAMATGIPALIPNAHGISEYFNSDICLELKVESKTQALYNRFRGMDVGEMVQCSVDDLRAKMRYAYSHQAEMHELGKRAAEYAKQYTYENTATQLAGIIKKWQHAPVQRRKDSDILPVEAL